MQVRLVCSVFIVWGSITVCMHYVWVVRSASGWWFGGVTVLRVEGRGWGDYGWSGASRIKPATFQHVTQCLSQLRHHIPHRSDQRCWLFHVSSCELLKLPKFAALCNLLCPVQSRSGIYRGCCSRTNGAQTSVKTGSWAGHTHLQ